MLLVVAKKIMVFNMYSNAADKQMLRRKMLNCLRNMGDNERAAQSQIIKEKLVNTPQWNQSHKISIYVSMKYEIDTMPIIKKIFADNKKCFVPVIQENDEIGMALLATFEELSTLQKYHPLSIESGQFDYADGTEMDLIIVPGLAFDKSCGRLGRGKGYYDKFISHTKTNCIFKQKKAPTFLALAFSNQLLDQVPMEPHDQYLDFIIDSV